MKRVRLLATVLLVALAAALLPAPASAASKEPVRGVYLTPWNAADPEKLEEILGLIDRTELNAIVLDVKDDSGRITFPATERVAASAGAVRPFIHDIKSFTADLHARGVYLIARMVTFKDPIVAPAYPDMAAADVNGGIWRDYNGVPWLNPYSRDSWEYVVRIAEAAADAGFDEIQFDYVRFPTDGKLSNLRYPGKDNRAEQDVIAGFLAFARERLAAKGVPISADVFGLVTSAWDDMGIGQHLEEIAASVDFVSPMLYPSHYEKGNLGVANPNAMPYETVYRSLEDARDRIAEAGLSGKTSVRPWLQDFSWGYDYGPDEVRAQIQAAYDAGYDGWLLWNAANVYTEAALKPAAPWPAYQLRPTEVGATVTVEVNGKVIVSDVQPFIARSSGRTLVPLRAIAEALGATVEWHGESRTAQVWYDGMPVQVTLGEHGALVGGGQTALDQPAVLWQDRTMVPVRFLAQAFGASVTWDGARNVVQITTP